MTADLNAIDDVLTALAEPMRREVLARLALHGETTATVLAGELPVSRQAIVQHLSVLDRAGLAHGQRRGREQRYSVRSQRLIAAADWMSHVAAAWDDRLAIIRRLAETSVAESGRPDSPDEMADRSDSHTAQQSENASMAERTFRYVTYIATTPEILWVALTDSDRTAEYWGRRNISDWQPGSSWEHQRLDDSHAAEISGVIVECAPPRRLVHTWAFAQHPRRQSQVAFDIEPVGKITRLTVTHGGLEAGAEYEGTAAGWSKVLSNLKSYLETGRCLPDLW